MELINPLTGKPYMGRRTVSADRIGKEEEAQAAPTSSSANAEGTPLKATSKKRLSALSVLRENREKWADLFLARLFYDRAERSDRGRDNKLKLLEDVPLAAFIGKSLSGDFVKDLQNYLDEKDSPLYGYENFYSFKPVLAWDLSRYKSPVLEGHPDTEQPDDRLYPLLEEWRDKIMGADKLSKAVVSKMLLDFDALDATEEALFPYLSRKDNFASELTKAYLIDMGFGKYAKEPSSPWALDVVKKYALPISGAFDSGYEKMVGITENIRRKAAEEAMKAREAREAERKKWFEEREIE